MAGIRVLSARKLVPSLLQESPIVLQSLTLNLHSQTRTRGAWKPRFREKREVFQTATPLPQASRSDCLVAVEASLLALHVSRTPDDGQLFKPYRPSIQYHNFFRNILYQCHPFCKKI